MFNEIKLRNFKCFKKWATIPLKSMNLFTGINGRGKSTVLQTLLLMQQSCEFSKATNRLIFNGSSIELGNFTDVKNSSFSKADLIEFIFSIKGNEDFVELHYQFKENEKDEMVADIHRIDMTGKYKNEPFKSHIERDKKNYRLHHEGKDYPVNWRNLIFQGLEVC